MKRLLLLLIALFLLPAPVSNAWIHGFVDFAKCPYGNTYNDGCAAAPAGGNIQHATFFTGYANQSSQVYANRPQWNVPGVDYAVGLTVAQGSLLDPTNNANLPSGCAYSAGANTVNCTGSGTLNLSGLDFSLHNGVRLFINGTYTAINMTNVYMLNGSASNVANGNLLRVDSNSVVSKMIITNCVFDNHADTYFLNDDIIKDNRANASTLTITYSAFLRFGGHGVSMGTSGSPVAKYNYIEGYEHGGPQHGEWDIHFNSAIATWTMSFNTFLQPAVIAHNGEGSGGGTTGLSYLSSGTSGTIITTTNIDHNVFVSNTRDGVVGGLAQTSTGAVATDRATLTTINMTENWVDPTGAFHCFLDAGQGSIGTTNWTGNVNLLDGSTLNTWNENPACFGHATH